MAKIILHNTFISEELVSYISLMLFTKNGSVNYNNFETNLMLSESHLIVN